MEDKTKTYLITNIDVFEVSENEAYWIREPEMHPIKDNEPIRNIEAQIWQQLRPVKFSRNGKIFSIALPPELQDFFCLPFEEFEKMDKLIIELNKLIEQKSAEFAELGKINTSMFLKIANLTDEVCSLKGRLKAKEELLRSICEISEKNSKMASEVNHAGFLKRLKYLFTARF